MGALRLGFTLTVRFGFGLGFALGVGVACPPTGGVGRVLVVRAAGRGVGVVLDAMTGGGGVGFVAATLLEPVDELLRHQRPLLLSSAQRST